ncbi:MAG TPA: ABC transporter ATP-binding protein, partial [Planctomycetaceae bacterium]|nr:ABC transporter ATP-binding protein [Planctomycetaceae bacterium]
MIKIEDVSIRFRGPALLDSVSTTIQVGDRIGLLGRNGAGKTTFLKILTGSVEPDHGQIVTREGTRVALLQQDVPDDLDGTTHAIVSSGLADSGLEEWEVERRTDTLLSRMGLSPESAVGTMSSGLKRRVLLAKSLVSQPDLLLLDEPTNHLDIDSIRWLENFLQGWQQAFMFITHDRQFLRQLASRILEIESGRLFDWTCDYDTFLRRKEEQLAAAEKQEALFDKKLAEEEAWIREGIKARRTRNEGRVRRLKELREQRSERASKQGTSNLQIQDSQRSGNLVLKASEVSFSRGDRPIVEGFSTTIMRGDKVGIVGPNGAGKTTLLKLLLGQLQPDSGSVRLGTNLQIAYFDQLRDQLDLTKSAEEEVADGYQTV